MNPRAPLPQALLFDFDFTLGDSSSAIVDCVAHACCVCGRSAPAPSDIHALIGLPLPVIHQRLGGSQELESRFVAAFHERADSVMEAATTVFPEGLEAVGRARRAGIKTGIVSTKYRWRLEGLLERRGHRALFDTIVGLEDVPAPKPDPAGLLLAARRLEVSPQRILYIGDHEVDAKAAASAGVAFLGVLTGATTAEAFRGWGAESLATLADLPGRLGIVE